MFLLGQSVLVRSRVRTIPNVEAWFSNHTKTVHVTRQVTPDPQISILSYLYRNTLFGNFIHCESYAGPV